MPPRRQTGLGAMREIRQELKQATNERKDADQRIRRLRAAEAALHGRRSPNAKVLNREQLKSYLAQSPGSRSIDIADALGVPATNVRTLLSALKKTDEVTNKDQRWSLTEHTN
jgi:hypothetical protein